VDSVPFWFCCCIFHTLRFCFEHHYRACACGLLVLTCWFWANMWFMPSPAAYPREHTRTSGIASLPYSVVWWRFLFCLVTIVYFLPFFP
jgi:hypothetical protein